MSNIEGRRQPLKFNGEPLIAENKTGLIKADATGYYLICLGALGIENSVGHIYDVEAGEQALMLPDFQNNIRERKLRAEWGHPLPLPGQSRSDYFLRLTRIDEKFQCAHIRSVEIDKTGKIQHNGKPVVAFIGEVRPTGPYGEYLEKQLQNPDENVCFSIRSFTRDATDPRTGKKIKYLEEILTFDCVNNCGIAPATKFTSPALEAASRVLSGSVYESFSDRDLMLAKHSLQQNSFGLESSLASAAMIDRLLKQSRWTEKPLSKTRIAYPPSVKW